MSLFFYFVCYDKLQEFYAMNDNKLSLEEEKQIVKRAQKGDKKALTQIVNANEQLVYNTALRLVGNRDDAECVLQETFIKVIEALPKFKGESSISTWIYRIATNYALMKLRDRKKSFHGIDDIDTQVSKSALESFNLAIGNNPYAAVENAELQMKMEEAIGKLPEKFRTVFILKDIEGLSLKEITELTDMSLPAVKSNLHRARLFLRDQLAEYVDRINPAEKS